jgi:hypothetical protein
MARPKGKDQLLAEIAYRDGAMAVLGLDDVVDESAIDAMVETGADIALKKWKEQTGGKKPQPTDVEIARKDWIAAGKPKEGIRRRSGTTFIFKKTDDESSDGEYDVAASLKANFGAD